MALVSVDRISDPGTFQPMWQFSGAGAGEPVRVPQFVDKSYGMWGVWGGTVVIQGSWDKSNFPSEDSFILLNESDNSDTCSATSDQIGVILENPVWIRANCTVAVTDVKVVINCTLSSGG